jgi:Holliday junction resolvase RusA-like endonuclease
MSDSDAVRVWVSGLPRPQGSKVSRQGRVLDANPASRPWRNQVAAALEVARGGTRFPGAVQVEADFRFPEPKTGTPLRRKSPFTRATPDLDKLLRAAFDAIQQAGVVRDDCQIVSVLACKRYVAEASKEDVGLELSIVPTPQDRADARPRLYE